MELAVILAMVSAFIAWGGSYFLALKRGYVNLVDWFIGTGGLLFSVIYVLVLQSVESRRNPLWENWIVAHEPLYWLPPLLSVMLYLSVWAGSSLAVQRSQTRHLLRLMHPVRSLAPLTYLYRYMAWGMLVVGILSYWLYSKAYGGFAKLWMYLLPAQRGIINLGEIDNPWSFLNRFGAFSWFAVLLFAGIVLQYQGARRTRIWDIAGLVLSIIFSLFVLSTWLARVFVTSFLLILLLGYLYWRRQSVHTFFLLSALLFVSGASIVYGVTTLIDPGKLEDDVMTFYAKEVSFPAASLFMAIERDQYRYFSDLAALPLHFLPQRILYSVIGIETATDVNTAYFLGARKGVGEVGYGIPVDILSFGYLQAGVWGVIVVGLFVGFLLTWLDRWIRQVPLEGARAMLYAYAAIMVSALSVAYADPVHVVRRNFHFFIGFAVVSLAPRFLFKQRRPSNETQRAQRGVS